MPWDVLNLEIVGCDDVRTLYAFLRSSRRIGRRIFQHARVCHAKHSCRGSHQNKRSSDGHWQFDSCHRTDASSEVLNTELLLGGIWKTLRKIAWIDDDATQKMFVSSVFVAERMIADQPFLQRFQTILVSARTSTIIHIHLVWVSRAFFLNGRGDQRLHICDVGPQSHQRDDDAVTLLGGVLEEDVGRELVDGQFNVKPSFIGLNDGRDAMSNKFERTHHDLKKQTHLEMVVAISQDLRPFGRDGRNVEVVGGWPICCADGDGIVDSGCGTDRRGEGRKSLLEHALDQP